MNELKNTLTNLFGLPEMSDNTWERKRNIFLKAVNAIDYTPKEEKPITETTPANEEYIRLQVEKLKREEVARKQAIIRGNIVSSKTLGSRILKIFNAGQSTAYNVRVEWLNEDDNVILTSDFSEIGELTPQNSRSYALHLAIGHSETMMLRYSWDDEYATGNTIEESLQL
jgi:hypothetical protein